MVPKTAEQTASDRITKSCMLMRTILDNCNRYVSKVIQVYHREQT